MEISGSTPAVKARQRIERSIAKVTIKALLDAGYSLGVYDGEETTIQYSRDAHAVLDAMGTTDEDYLYVYEPNRSITEPDKRPDWWVRFIYGNDGWDVISDYCVALEEHIGEGTAVQKLIDRYIG